ncbi:MAG: type I phosphomannose isomerase catalytic subunit, partial [Pseudolysinimonas sp.]
MFVEITNSPRDYAWGSITAIPELLGTTPSGRPEAELWLGAHPGSPARLVGRDGTLADVVTGRLPFLLKVLAAASNLSLQAHPTTAQAEAGFAAENAAGIPLDAPERNYKDAFHKPELIYALSDPFRALCGFRAVADTRTLLLPV